MGLDTTHGCWHGGYISFMCWREAVAKAAGFPPLPLMAGFFRSADFFMGSMGLRGESARLGEMLPIRWDYYEKDPLVVLLTHSDCDGEIEAKDCGPIAERLAEILPKMPKGDGGGHIGDWRAKTQAFIDGLRLAAAANEPVGFH